MSIDTTVFGFNRPYVFNPGRNFYPVYLPAENYSMYFNSDYNIDDTTYVYWRLRLLDYLGNIIFDIDPVQAVFITPTLYNVYLDSFVFPFVPDGYYYFQIYNTFLFEEVYRTNAIQVWSDCIYTTTPVKFRHNDQLFGVRYDLLPNFYQKFRLPLNQIKAPEIRSEREQYRQSSNGRELRTSKSFRDVVMTLEMYWANDEDMVALSAINEHSDVFVSGNRLIQLNQIKIERASERSNQNKATFECIVDDYNLDKSLLDNYGDFIMFGGNEYNVLTTFVDS